MVIQVMVHESRSGAVVPLLECLYTMTGRLLRLHACDEA